MLASLRLERAGEPARRSRHAWAFSPFAKTGYVSNVEYSHYSLLATLEAIFNLGTLGRNDTSAAPMSDMFRGGIP